MTEHVVRLYAAVIALVVFFLFWAVIAARPWAAAGESDPRMETLQRREQALAAEAKRVNRVVKRRFARYERQLARRKRAIARRERENAAAVAAASAPATGGGTAAVAPSSSGVVAAAPAAPPVAVTTTPPVTSTGSS
jgi:septal ring factor EnvC (AmiA/AmiB activator)